MIAFIDSVEVHPVRPTPPTTRPPRPNALLQNRTRSNSVERAGPTKPSQNLSFLPAQIARSSAIRWRSPHFPRRRKNLPKHHPFRSSARQHAARPGRTPSLRIEQNRTRSNALNRQNQRNICPFCPARSRDPQQYAADRRKSTPHKTPPNPCQPGSVSRSVRPRDSAASVNTFSTNSSNMRFPLDTLTECPLFAPFGATTYLVKSCLPFWSRWR